MMRILIIILSVILASVSNSSLFGQEISEARVFFDDPANGYQSLSITPSQTINDAFSVDVSSLTNGIHTIYIEVKNTNGVWSLYDKDLIQVTGNSTLVTLQSVEYFFDQDPGFGEGIQIATNANTLNQPFEIDVAGLSNGIHLLYIRVRDNSGVWSLSEKKIIHVVGSMSEELVQAEYFFNTDPGFGNANSIDLSLFANQGSLEVDIEGLTTGVHRLYIRVKDAAGIWSIYSINNVIVTNEQGFIELVQAEYYFDNDPGLGNGFPLLISPATSISETFNVSVPNNLTGTHTICVRVKNENNEWSATSCETFQICSFGPTAIQVNGENCQSDPFVLSIQDNNYDQILWSTGETGASIEITEEGVYAVTITDNGCSSTSQVNTVFQLSHPLVFVEAGSACEGEEQTLFVADVFDSYSWSTGGNTNSITTTSSGLYTLLVVDGSCVLQETYNLQLINLPTPTISSNGNTLTCSLPGYTYQWYYNGLAINNATQQTFQALVPGAYAVSISAGICNEFSNELNFVPVSVDENAFMESIQIYPNPVSDKLFISANANIGELVLYNLLGEVLLKERIMSTSFVCDMSNYACGVYLLQFDNKSFYKIIRE